MLKMKHNFIFIFFKSEIWTQFYESKAPKHTHTECKHIKNVIYLI
jgi:hypothetical protein